MKHLFYFTIYILILVCNCSLIHAKDYSTSITVFGTSEKYEEVYAPPKLVPVIIRDYSLTFGKKQYEKDTIFGDANSHHSTVA